MNSHNASILEIQIYKEVFSFFREEWHKLLSQIETRHQKLMAASELHRFKRDVAEALDRIQVSLSRI